MQSIAWVCLLMIFGMPAAAQSGYNVILDPGIQVTDNPDGSSLVTGRFKLFNGQAPSNDLGAGDLSMCVDDLPVQGTIIPPGQGTGVKMADVVFCMDISGSMSGEINAVKNNTAGFVNKLTNQNYDVRLGLITHGQSPAPYLRKRNNGQFYTSPQNFLNEVNGLHASGGREEWFDCLVQASQYPFRAGADRIAILVTDENGDSKSYNIDTALPVVVNNAAKVFGISYGNLGNVMKAVNGTNGSLYNIYDPFDDILDKIANSIANTYTASAIISAAPGEHKLCVEPVQNATGKDEKTFKIGANPVVALTPPTQALVADGVNPGTGGLTVSASVIDQDGTVQSVNIFWEDPAGNTGTEAMTPSGTRAGHQYNYVYTGMLANVGDCFGFSIQAIDNEGRNTTVPANQGNSPGGKWRICASNTAPVISAVTPDAYNYLQATPISAEVADDGTTLAVTLKYRQKGDALWTIDAMANVSTGSTTYTATVPAAVAGFKGIELEVVAQDAHNAVSTITHALTVNSVPVSIIDVTRHTDTLDTGPFSVHAVVAGLDLASGGLVELAYTINGGASASLSMTQAVTGTMAPMQVNANIYVEKIPAVNAGDKICYSVKASNPTANIQSQESCFEVLQPAQPLVLTPASAILAVGDGAIELIASGGYGSYAWSTLNGDLSTDLGDKIRYTPTISGLDKVSAKDLKGFSATAIIQVLPALRIEPPVQGRRFSPSSTVVLTAGGGEPGYTWEIKGAVSSPVSGQDGEIVEIALGADPAAIDVKVTDNGGRVQSVSFTNNGVLRISPADATVMPGSETTFTASGGFAPYAWKTVGGDVDDPAAASVAYKAPAVPGVYHLSVTDAGGDYAMVTIRAGDPLRVTPHCARIQRGDTADFEVVSGLGPFAWEADFGSLSAVSGSRITYTPEDHAGLYQVWTYDASGSVINLCVDIADAITVSKSSLTLETGESASGLTAKGGTPPYTWRAERGTVDPLTGAAVTYTAPADLGDGIDKITVKDNAGNEAAIQVLVVFSRGKIDELACTPGADGKVIFLSPGVSQLFACNAPVQDIRWTASAGNIASDGTFTAPDSSGTIAINAVDSRNGRSFSIQARVTAQLTLTPTQATLLTGKYADFSVSGGEAPYRWKVIGEGLLDTSTGDRVQFTAGLSAGNPRLVVMDNAGVSSETQITVVSDCLISPVSAVLLPEGIQKFTLSGGSGNAVFAVDQGTIDASGNYTAPVGVGVYEINAEAGACKAKASVTVANIPIITPANAWVGQNGAVSFSVVGGTPPYHWTAVLGELSVSGNMVAYQAPGVSTEVTVSVTDNQGLVSAALVYVDQPLRTTRAELFVEPGNSTRVAVTGGIPPFTWQTIRGDMASVNSDDAGHNIYTAPNVIGDDTISISDQANHTATVAVHVTPIITVTPNRRYMKTTESKTFTVVSGIAPFTATVDGDGEISPSSPSQDGVFTFTSGNTADEDVVIEFRDNGGQSIQAHAFVEGLFTPSTTDLFLDRSEQASFSVSGGTGGFFAQAIGGGTAIIDETTGIGTYTALDRYGDDYQVTISDSSGSTVSIDVTVDRSVPVISPLEAVLEPGETRTFMVNRGAKPYEWSFTGNLWQGMDDENSVIQITAPETSGSYTLSVEDVAGNLDPNTGQLPAASVTVVQKPLLAPTSYVAYQGESVKVRINRSGGTGACDWTYNELQPVMTGTDYLVVQPRTDVELGIQYLISCRDGKGDKVSSTITVGRLPGDLDKDGQIDSGEARHAIDKHFDQEDNEVNGVGMDRALLYVHMDAFLAVSSR
ncbi:MAG: VWA domain-containing protein [Gammaproteobacteria bacterium]|nr:VWA domain-containing protein [Gammaproteobacteria bacterium]